MTFPLWLKFKASLQYGVNYAFTVVVQNVNNPYAVSSSLAFNVAFALPAANDSVTAGITPTKCEQLQLSSTGFSGSNNTISITSTNWNQQLVTVTSLLDNNQVKSPCGVNASDQSYLIAYYFGGISTPSMQVLSS